jgi:hypothetical protein
VLFLNPPDSRQRVRGRATEGTTRYGDVLTLDFDGLPANGVFRHASFADRPFPATLGHFGSASTERPRSVGWSLDGGFLKLPKQFAEVAHGKAQFSCGLGSVHPAITSKLPAIKPVVALEFFRCRFHCDSPFVEWSFASFLRLSTTSAFRKSFCGNGLLHDTAPHQRRAEPRQCRAETDNFEKFFPGEAGCSSGCSWNRNWLIWTQSTEHSAHEKTRVSPYFSRVTRAFGGFAGSVRFYFGSRRSQVRILSSRPRKIGVW